MVWYRYGAWRLGIIITIAQNPGASETAYRFTLAPLGHACLNLQPLTNDVMNMRPFLTFSVPSTTLPEIEGKSFHQIDWPTLAAQAARNGEQTNMLQMLGLEASKLAAKYINDSYSTFSKLSEQVITQQPGLQYLVQRYRGIYLGAEMIGINDPVRVAAVSTSDPASANNPSDTTAVMLVSGIHVITALSQQGQQQKGSMVQLRGSIYRLVKHHANMQPQGGAGVIADPLRQLGPVFAEEAATRNQLEQEHEVNKHNNMRWSWVLTQQDAARREPDVLGRFYVTRKLMGYIDPDALSRWVEAGELREAHVYLNNRATSVSEVSGGNKVAGMVPRKATRGETLGLAISAHARFTTPEGMVEE